MVEILIAPVAGSAIEVVGRFHFLDSSDLLIGFLFHEGRPAGVDRERSGGGCFERSRTRVVLHLEVSNFAAFRYLEGEDFVPVSPFLGVLGQHAPNQLLQHRGSLVGLRYPQLILIENHDEFPDVIGLEGAEAVHHPVEDHAEGPNVCLHGVGLAFEDLGSHVDGRTQHSFGHPVLVFQWLTESKVCDFEDAIVNEDVLGLDVTVHDVVFGQDLEAVD